MLKRASVAIFLIIMLIIFASSNLEPSAPKNTIGVLALSGEQQDLVDLLKVPGHLELVLFGFRTEQRYSQMDFWVESYQYGVLVDRPAGLQVYGDEAYGYDGRLCLIIDRQPQTRWTLIVDADGGKASHTGTSGFSVEPSLAYVYGPMNGVESIEDGKEIILYTSLYAGDGLIHAYDSRTLQEEPELLRPYPYAHLVKCKFFYGDEAETIENQ